MLSNRDAQPVPRALAIFEELGARVVSGNVRAELARISGRPAGGDEPTGTEVRVAELAATGRSNKEIAAKLLTDLSTVEAAPRTSIESVEPARVQG